MDPASGEITTPPDPHAKPETPAEATTEDTPATDVQAVDQPEGEDEYDEPAGIAPQDLSKEINDNPALKEFLDSNPEFKDKVFANARLAAKVNEFQEIFRTPAEARISATEHGKFSNLKTIMGELDGSPKSANDFIQAMLPESYLLNEDGTPQLDQNGKPRHDGSVYKFLKGAYQLRMDNLRNSYINRGDNDAAAAVDLLMERQGFTAPSTLQEDGSPELQQQREQIRQERAELDRMKAQDAQTKAAAFTQSLDEAAGDIFDAEIGKRLKIADGLSAPSKTVERIKDLLAETLDNKPTFRTERDSLLKRPQTDKVKGEYAAFTKRYMQQYLPQIIARVLREDGTTEIEAQNFRQSQQSARAEASRSEARGSGTTGPKAPAAPMDGAQLRNVVTQELRTQLGREPLQPEILRAIIERRQKAA